MSSAKLKSVAEMILAWSATRPAWQQDALRRIVVGGALDAAGIAELVQLCKKGCGAPDIALSPIPLSPAHFPAAAAVRGQDIVLTTIADVEGVNRLAAGQELLFAAQGITVVYGDNGVGKSGYSRILKRACRARFPGEILPNAFDPMAPEQACATIAYMAGGIPAAPIAWRDEGTPHSVLAAVSVFDRDSGQVHVQGKNEVAFRPFGLDIPDDLAALTVAVKEALTSEQARLEGARDGAFTQPTFSAETAVGKFLRALSANTDLAPLEALETLTSEEEGKLQRLNADLLRDPLKASEEQRILAGSLTRLANDLAAVLARTADSPLSHLLLLSDEARSKRAAAVLAAETAFAGAAMPGVGEATWRALWDAARRYSSEVAGKSFPHPGSDAVCVLCHQPLSEAAGRRMSAFEAFVKADTERQAKEAEAALAECYQELLAKPVKISGFSVRQQLVVRKPDLARSILRCLAAARLRRASALASAMTGGEVHMPELPPSPEAAIRQLASEALVYANELAEVASLEGRKRLEHERDELRDRAALAELLPKARTEVARLASLALLKKCLSETATNAITGLGNSIADEVITPRVRDRFQEEIQKLAASRVRVDIVRSGGKYGSPHYQIRLFANEKARVGEVLSEGEQTCVALAAFLTEMATSADRSTLVFDDPVSSLDHRWRHKVAERLIEEAGVRQVIVFTHDLIFLNDLQSLALENGVPLSAFSLRQSADGAGIVSTDLPWIAAKVPERVDNLEKEACAAKILFDTQDDAGYAEAVAKIYNRLRSTWERALEDVAFCGVVTRHRDYINSKDLMKVTALEEPDVKLFQAGYKKCCDQTNAHDPSRGRNAPSPPPDEVLADIGQLRPWVDGIRSRQKAIK
ncbi:AAA family ATPase [Bradyrhizobium sp. McL0616]|uniref:AAA family ATPase n=1 Tax=Bradyrhizobium sp. McL0616 TaxID=3415674 RepID=UPI003CF807ED